MLDSTSGPIIKKPILLEELHQFSSLDQVIIESLEQALYRLEVVVDNTVYFVNEAPGKSLTRRNIVDLQSLLTPFIVGKMYLRQLSPYDEMIGHPVNQYSNELLVPLGNVFDNLMAEKNNSTAH